MLVSSCTKRKARRATGPRECAYVHVHRPDQGHVRGQGAVRKGPEYLAKIGEIIEFEGGVLERTLAVMGPWDFLAIVKYPDNETAFRVLAKIAKLEVVETETFPAEDVSVFMKALV